VISQGNGTLMSRGCSLPERSYGADREVGADDHGGIELPLPLSPEGRGATASPKWGPGRHLYGDKPEPEAITFIRRWRGFSLHLSGPTNKSETLSRFRPLCGPGRSPHYNRERCATKRGQI
jgi:hypothetical protein